jgi:ADP-ribosylglycohydrolase
VPGQPDRAERALRSLDGLSVGDAFGQRAFGAAQWVLSRQLPPGPWRWTDDTAMACALVEVLAAEGRVVQDQLARRLAERFVAEPHRGYGAGAAQLLHAVALGGEWEAEAASLFRGRGSYGNGAAMRVAPLGAWYADDPDRAAQEARAQAAVTHAHLEGVEAAAAIAVAAARLAAPDAPPAGVALLREVAAGLAPSETRSRIELAADLDPTDADGAAGRLGNGSGVAGFDTAPFCLWVAAHFRTWEEALFTTAGAFGDVDTTCAIVGGVLALPSGGPPAAWRERREALPAEIVALSTGAA